MSIGEQDAAISLAKRIADGGGDDDDVAVLLDWIHEREEHRAHERADSAIWDRPAWWRKAFQEDRDAAAFAIALGAEDMSGPELVAALQKAVDDGGHGRSLAIRFEKLCGKRASGMLRRRETPPEGPYR